MSDYIDHIVVSDTPDMGRADNRSPHHAFALLLCSCTPCDVPHQERCAIWDAYGYALVNDEQVDSCAGHPLSWLAIIEDINENNPSDITTDEYRNFLVSAVDDVETIEQNSAPVESAAISYELLDFVDENIDIDQILFRVRVSDVAPPSMPSLLQPVVTRLVVMSDPHAVAPSGLDGMRAVESSQPDVSSLQRVARPIRTMDAITHREQIRREREAYENQKILNVALGDERPAAVTKKVSIWNLLH